MRERLVALARVVALPLGVGLVLGLIGPFGTFDSLRPGPRVAYWLAVVSLNWMLADLIIRRTDAATADLLPLPRVSVPLLGALVTALPATGTVALANGLSGIGWPEDVPRLGGQVLLLLAAISLPVYAWQDLRERVPQGGKTANGSEALPLAGTEGLALFQARLSRPLDGRLICLEMQDHYLVVHADSGQQMILCRMDDAARELAALGLRVHRSWWVAADAVAAVERAGQRMFLRLTDGRRVPVGRSFRPHLKAAGWLS